MRVALIGPLPPPYGGVSVHVARLHTALVDRGIDVEVLTGTERVADGARSPVGKAAKVLWYGRQLLYADFDLVHFHGVASQLSHLRKFALLAAVGRPVVVTLHSFRSGDAPGPRSVLTRLALRRMDHVICVGEQVHRSVLSWGGVAMERTSLLSPYLPPDRSGPRTIAPAARAFIARHRPLLVANASKLFRIDGQDVYGVDTCMALTRALAEDYPHLGFLFIVAEVRDEEYYRSVLDRIEISGLSDRFMILQSNEELWPILEQATAFLRPTITDSFGMSVAEAIAFGVPAIASDICTRPPGTLLFRTGDFDDALRQTRRVLAEQAPTAMPDRPRPASETLERILDVYADVVGSRDPESPGSVNGVGVGRPAVRSARP